MIETIIHANSEELEELLLKIGITQESASTLAPFMSSLASAYEGLIIKGLSDRSAQDIYNAVIAGFMISHPAIQKEFEALRNDKERLEAALKTMLEAITKNIMKAAEAAKVEDTTLEVEALPKPPTATLH